MQRFDSTLGCFVHFHVLVPDGLFRADAAGAVVVREGPAPARASRASSSRHTPALAMSSRLRPLPEPFPAQGKSKPGLRARAIGGASVGSPRCATRATTTARSEMSLTIAIKLDTRAKLHHPVRRQPEISCRHAAITIGELPEARDGRVRAWV